jgi:hypothetical protein
MKANTNTVREHACDYLQRKWPPIKLKPRSKEPPSGTHAANTITWDNVDKLTTDDNIGVQFAESADLKDLDLDYQTAADLAKEVSLTGATTGFGRKSVGIGHLLFKAPGCEAKKFELPISDGYPKPLPLHKGEPSGLVLEIRGADNTYTMFPPSIHPETGETLEWNGSGREPLEITAGELRTLAGQHAVAAAVLYFYPTDATARYEVRMALTGALVRAGMNADRVCLYVQAVAKLASDPKWQEDFATRTEKRLEDDKKVTGIPRLVQVLQLPEACKRMFREWLLIDAEPTPLFPPLPPSVAYPTQALGGMLAKAAFAIAHKVQVPEAIAAQSVLAATALTAQAIADIRLPYGQTRPLSLYFVTDAFSGDRKTSADTEALWPIRKREQALGEIFRDEHYRWSINNAAWTAERKKIEGNRKISFSERKAALEQLGPAPEQPLHPFLTAPDPTIEGLTKAWVHAPASLGLFSAEGGQFIGGYGMSQDHRLKTAAALSEMWEAKTIKRIRASDGVTILRGRRLSMHMLVQPEASASFLSDPILRGQGLLSRIMVAAPDSIAGTRLYRDTDAQDDAAIRDYGARILQILEMRWPLAEGQRNELNPPELTIAPDAAQAWIEFYNAVERRCGPNNELGAIGDFAAKAAEQAARIAGVLTIFHNPGATEVDAGAMGNAVVIMDWYINETLRLQRAARTDAKLIRAQRLLDWLQERGPEIDVRDIMQTGPAAERSKAAADETLAILKSHGWVREVSKRPYRIAVVRASEA